MAIQSFLSFLKSIVDIRDLFVFGGTGLIAYGFYLIAPSLGYIMAGLILFWLGMRNSIAKLKPLVSK